jgi:hypothetical protein
MRKALLISGIILTCIISLGVVFRLLHFPGSSQMLVLGIGAVMVYFLPALSIYQLKNARTTGLKATIIFGAVVGILFLFPGLLFSIQRWPGGTLLFFAGIAGAIIFTFLYFITRSKAGDPVTPREPFTLIVLVLVVVLFGGRLFVREAANEKLKENNASYYSAMEQRQDADHAATEAYVKVLNDTNDTAAVRSAEELHRATIDVLQYINETRGEVVGWCMNIDPKYGDTLSVSLIDRPGDYDTPTHYFIGSDPANVTGKSKELSAVLKTYYNRNYSSDKVKKIIPDDIYSEEHDKLISWEWNNFYHKTILEALTTLLKIQTDILNAEKEALEKKEFKIK